jgi:hypothetical protein
MFIDRVSFVTLNPFSFFAFCTLVTQSLAATNHSNNPNVSSPDSLDFTSVATHRPRDTGDTPLDCHTASSQPPRTDSVSLQSQHPLPCQDANDLPLHADAEHVAWRADVPVESERALSPMSASLRDTIERTMTRVMRSSDKRQEQNRNAVAKSPKRRSPHPFSTLIPRPRWKSPGASE